MEILGLVRMISQMCKGVAYNSNVAILIKPNATTTLNDHLVFMLTTLKVY
jgi:hypothetical protein